MNFRIDPFKDGELIIPNITFDDGLHFSINELSLIKNLLCRLLRSIHRIILDLTNRFPEEMKFYKKPKSWSE